MAHILIDGYNLIGIAHTSLEKARGRLIEDLNIYSELKDHNITVVFDGWKNGLPIENSHRIGRTTVIYSKLGEKADSVIKRILSEGKRPWIVVSSDREISDFADRKDCSPITADEFESRLFACLRVATDENPAGEPDAYDNFAPDLPARRKGNPRKLSKKQKKKLQALRKL